MREFFAMHQSIVPYELTLNLFCKKEEKNRRPPVDPNLTEQDQICAKVSSRTLEFIIVWKDLLKTVDTHLLTTEKNGYKNHLSWL